MRYLSVPCPLCEGLVDRDAVKCQICGVSWESIIRMCGEGVSRTEEYLLRFALHGEWIEEKITENLQTVIDLFTLVDRYYRQMEIELR